MMGDAETHENESLERLIAHRVTPTYLLPFFTLLALLALTFLTLPTDP
jgi:hypothetical protein